MQAYRGDFGVQLHPFWWAGSQAPPLLASSISSVIEGGCFNTAPRFSKGEIPKRSRMWSPQQGSSSWFLGNLQLDTLKWGRYQTVWKNFGKRLRVARSRTEGHGCTMSWLPSVANPTFSPVDPHPMVHPSYFQGVNTRQFFHHSDGKRQRTLKVTLDTRQRHLKASQCHQVLFCLEGSKSSSSQAHCTLSRKNPWCWEHIPCPRASGVLILQQGVSMAVNRNLGRLCPPIQGCFSFGPGNTGVMQTPDCASLIIYSVTQDELIGKDRILQGRGGRGSSPL